VVVKKLDDPRAFLEAAGTLLLEDEARHNLVLGIAGTLRDHPRVYPERRLWLVLAEGQAVGAALQTPPFNLVLARPLVAAALRVLARALHADHPELPGVTGAVPEVDAFTAAWEGLSGRRGRARMAQRIYRLTAVRPVRDAAGSPRVATEADRELLVSWVRAFAEEAGGSGGPGDPERIVGNRLEIGAGGFVLWEDEEPVSLAGWGGETPNGIRIGPVYTPREHRRRGYGSAVTAAVSAQQLAAGRRFCFLYTDLANPTSNKIYTDIGYEPVCDSVDYAFEPR
jgi:hypothetical protein